MVDQFLLYATISGYNLDFNRCILEFRIKIARLPSMHSQQPTSHLFAPFHEPAVRRKIPERKNHQDILSGRRHTHPVCGPGPNPYQSWAVARSKALAGVNTASESGKAPKEAEALSSETLSYNVVR